MSHRMLALARETEPIAAPWGGIGGVRRLTRPPRAVLFDVDGTLYSQPPLRAAMALELAARFLRPSRARATARVVRTLRTFRRVREGLPARGRPVERLERLQVAETARLLGVDAAEVEAVVSEWMQRRPLRYLRLCRRRGLRSLLRRLRALRVPCGVLSDYPAAEKLRALGVADEFSPVLCTTDPSINALKPHPAGFLTACRTWRLAPEDVLYVGDRPTVDGAGAQAAGMPCCILGPYPSALWRLHRALANLYRL
jgi:HAD superfamily hydrolase (TIGR01549 family)